jgi:hypothetical protein
MDDRDISALINQRLRAIIDNFSHAMGTAMSTTDADANEEKTTQILQRDSIVSQLSASNIIKEVEMIVKLVVEMKKNIFVNDFEGIGKQMLTRNMLLDQRISATKIVLQECLDKFDAMSAALDSALE